MSRRRETDIKCRFCRAALYGVRRASGLTALGCVTAVSRETLVVFWGERVGGFGHPTDETAWPEVSEYLMLNHKTFLLVRRGRRRWNTEA